MERASRLAQKSTVSCVLNQSMFEKIRRVRWHTLLQQQTCSTRRSTKVRVWLANHSLQERMWELPPNCGPDLCGLVQTGDMACQGPNSLRITSHVLPAAVSFAQNLSRGGPIIVGKGYDVALRPAHPWQLPKQHHRLAVADQRSKSVQSLPVERPSLALQQIGGKPHAPAR